MKDSVACIAVSMCLVLAALSPGVCPAVWPARIVLWDEYPGEPEHRDRLIVIMPT